VGGTQNGASVTLALGDSATCTITNDDQTAHLTLVKVVVNDNGGTAVAADFVLSASGPTPISGVGGVSSDVNAGRDLRSVREWTLRVRHGRLRLRRIGDAGSGREQDLHDCE
jgi:hypothetical protein